MSLYDLMCFAIAVVNLLGPGASPEAVAGGCGEPVPGAVVTAREPIAGRGEVAPALRPRGEFIALETVPVVDNQGWGRPVVAATVLLPSAWSVEAGVTWNTSSVCLSDMVSRRLQARSPDGSLAFEMLPSARWQWGQNPLIQSEIQLRGCRVAAPIDAQGALRRAIVPTFRPGAVVREIVASPGAAAGLREEYYRVWGPLFEMQGATVNADAIRATLEYSVGGEAFEEWILLAVGEIITPSAAGPYHSYSIDFVYAFRAPRGELSRHERLLSTIVASVRNSPVWEAAYVGLVTSMNSTVSRQAGNRAAIWQDAMNQIGRTRVETWQRSQEAVSRVSTSWSRVLRGVDSYLDPASGQAVELPTGYENAWSDGLGRFILSPDPSFDPNVEIGRGSWQRMRQNQS